MQHRQLGCCAALCRAHPEVRVLLLLRDVSCRVRRSLATQEEIAGRAFRPHLYDRKQARRQPGGGEPPATIDYKRADSRFREVREVVDSGAHHAWPFPGGGSMGGKSLAGI